jgi:hypothetical protein
VSTTDERVAAYRSFLDAKASVATLFDLLDEAPAGQEAS